MKDLPNRLEIKAGVMEMGEKIAWVSDTSLMREAASEIRRLRLELENLKPGNGPVCNLNRPWEVPE